MTLFLQNRFPRAFEDDFFHRFLGTANSAQEKDLLMKPDYDLTMTNDHYLITLDIPGVKESDISIVNKEGILTISAERKEAENKKGKTFRRSSRYYGKMEASFGLPDEVDPSAIEADYDNGVLHVAIPKIKKVVEEPKTIPVKIKTGLLSKIFDEDQK